MCGLFINMVKLFAKHYEVSDHLGNVRAVIGDTKWDAGGGIFRPNVITYSNYYPFGMGQPGRNLNSKDIKGFAKNRSRHTPKSDNCNN
jgi:hypothetical protein